MGAEGASASPLDPTFGEGGISLTHVPRGEAALGLTDDKQGRLIAVGVTFFEDFAVRRYRANGTPDSSFGDNGEVQTSFGQGAAARAAVVQPDGKILVAGGAESAFALVRYDSAGNEDRHFGKHGRVLTPAGQGGGSAFAVAVQPNSRILAAGYGRDLGHRRRWTGMLVGYRPNGQIDRGFAKDGMFRIHVRAAYSVAFSGVKVLPSGKILVAGDLNGRLLLIRLLANGTPDRSFGGGDGRVLLDADGDSHCACSFANSLAIGPGGTLLLAGADTKLRSEAGLLVRFLPNGRPDRSFGKDGVVKTLRGSRLVNYGVAVQPNGRIITAGFYETSRTARTKVAVLRFLPTGEFDPSFGRSGFFTRHLGLLSVGRAVLPQPDGRVVVAGRANFAEPNSSPESESALDGAQFMLMRLR